MNALLVRIWRLFAGTPQWYILYLAHRKFILGVSGVVVNDHGQILLLRHRFWRPGTWGLPSGYANRHEKLEDTLRREVREETGYEVQVTRFLRMVSGFRLRLEVSFLGTITGGTCRLDPKEIIAAQFFPQEALPDGLLQSHREIIALAFSTPEPALIG
jgi:ADP-ribose pyrophosphatase YjhB (NUDIX family)